MRRASLAALGALLLCGGLIFAAAPLIAALVASEIAEQADCSLHEGFARACLIGGVDAGPALTAAFVSGWFMLATIPIGGMAALIGIVLLVVAAVRKLRRRLRTL